MLDSRQASRWEVAQVTLPEPPSAWGSLEVKTPWGESLRTSRRMRSPWHPHPQPGHAWAQVKSAGTPLPGTELCQTVHACSSIQTLRGLDAAVGDPSEV